MLKIIVYPPIFFKNFKKKNREKLFSSTFSPHSQYGSVFVKASETLIQCKKKKKKKIHISTVIIHHYFFFFSFPLGGGGGGGDDDTQKSDPLRD